jgi:hypothetical protein
MFTSVCASPLPGDQCIRVSAGLLISQLFKIELLVFLLESVSSAVFPILKVSKDTWPIVGAQ